MILERLKIKGMPVRSLTYLMICIGGVLAFVILTIYPVESSLKEADAEITKLKERLKEQEVLYPVFIDLLRKTRLKEIEGLPFPQKAKLKREDTAKISSVFQDIAQQSHLVFKNFRPEVDSLVETPGFLKMDLEVNGNFLDLRDFMSRLGELPYLEHIERLTIRSGPGYKALALKAWMAQE